MFDLSLWEKGKDINQWRRIGLQILLYFGLGICLFLLLMGSVAPKDYRDLRLGQKSEETIFSPVTTVDEEATKRARDAAASQIDNVYTKNDQITENQLANLDNIFEEIKRINSDRQLNTNARIEATKRAVIPYELSEQSYKTLASLPAETIVTMQYITKYIVEKIMQEGVMENENELLKAQVQVDKELVDKELASAARKVTQELAQLSIVPNVLYDGKKTADLKGEAREKVEPIYIVKGDPLVEYGHTITPEHLRKLELVGLMDANPFKTYIGLGILIILLLGFIRLYIQHSELSVKNNLSHLLMFFLILSLEVGIMKIFTVGESLEFEFIGFLAPAAFGSLLIAILLGLRLAYFSSILMGLVAGILFNETALQIFDFEYAIVAMVGSLVGSYVVGAAHSRSSILKAGFWISLANLVVMAALYLLTNQDINWSEILKLSAYGVISGLLSGVFALGFMPFFEAAFGILSSVKLIELSNPNQPLLRKLLLETPGTYHHSVMVANLSEAAAEAIGADGLLARVGSYYHDLGKTKRPAFFIENQMGHENPHDKISPQLSKTIITAHPYDGVKMLKEYKIPKAICDIAEQHHGTTLLKFFYHKALKENDQIREEDFRYPGPKAQFKESAIVGICDSVEAAVRSLSKPTPDRIDGLVRKIIKDRLDDGQFDECELTLKELDTIHRTIVQTLHGIFHSRIEYPNDEELEVKEA